MNGRCQGLDRRCTNEGELFSGCKYCGALVCADCKRGCDEWWEEVKTTEALRNEPIF